MEDHGIIGDNSKIVATIRITPGNETEAQPYRRIVIHPNRGTRFTGYNLAPIAAANTRLANTSMASCAAIQRRSESCSLNSTRTANNIAIADGIPFLAYVFVGLFTPLQGTAVIAEAVVEALKSVALEFTFVGTGQDLDAARDIVGANPSVTWREWIPAAQLPAFVAGHDVSLGIFGSSPKAQRVVPNKVYQGLSAGTVVISSDTPPQRRLRDGSAHARLRLVNAGDPHALAAELVSLATDPQTLRSNRLPTTPSLDPMSLTSNLSQRLSR